MGAVATAPKQVEQWHTVKQVMAITAFGRTFLHGEMESGRLKSKKVGGARRISASALAEWQASFDGSGEVNHED